MMNRVELLEFPEMPYAGYGGFVTHSLQCLT